MKKIKIGDEVIVIAGKDKGKQGKISKLDNKGNCNISGIKLVKKHTKPNPQAGIKGGILEQESLIDISNIAIFNNITSKADKVTFKALKDGKKIRIFKSNQEAIYV